MSGWLSKQSVDALCRRSWYESRPVKFSPQSLFIKKRVIHIYLYTFKFKLPSLPKPKTFHSLKIFFFFYFKNETKAVQQLKKNPLYTYQNLSDKTYQNTKSYMEEQENSLQKKLLQYIFHSKRFSIYCICNKISQKY